MRIGGIIITGDPLPAKRWGGRAAASGGPVVTPAQIVFLAGIAAFATSRQTSAPVGGVSEITQSDTRYLRSLSGAWVTDYRLVPLISGAKGGEVVEWESLDPDVATVDAEGVARFVNAGPAIVRCSFGTQQRTIALTFSEDTGQNDEFIGFVAGSLAAHCSAAVDTRLAGKAPSSALRLYTTQNHSAGTYVRNAGAWCGDLDLTCISPWNSGGGTTRAGTLVTPRHILFAAHYELGVGATVRFVKMDGETVTRTLVAKKRHPSYPSPNGDLTVGVLDADVPEGISPTKVAPSDLESYLPGVFNGVAGLCLDQEEKALVSDLAGLGSAAAFHAPADPQRLAFYENKIGGDSGNPAFLIVDDQLMLLCVWTYGGGGSGSDIGDHVAELNAMITAADTLAGNGGTGYTVTPADLSAFPSYA